jgi:hypothetical protein
MSKKNFKHHIRIRLDEELSKHDITGILMVLEKSVPNIFNVDNKEVHYHTENNSHLYDFKIERSLTESEGEVILQVIEQWTSNDFLLEVTTTEDYFLPENEYEVDMTSMRHNRWMSEKVANGWRYGLVFSETEMTDPRLRPYQELTDKLKNL